MAMECVVRGDSPNVSIVLTFDFDAMSTWIGTFGATSPSMISRGEFGPIGVHRILQLLADFNAKVTFFVPGHTAIAYPGVVAQISDAGHEIGHHGWVHENPARLTEPEERWILEQGLQVLEKVTGQRPVGYRSPAWDNSPHTVELLIEYGFEYESSLMGNDFEPYWCRVGDMWSTTGPYQFGQPAPLVELPVSWYMDDWVHFEYISLPEKVAEGLRPPSAVLETWVEEFNYLYDEIGRGMLVMTMHPEVIGRGYRLRMLRQFLEQVTARPGVHLVRAIDYIHAWKGGRKPYLPADAAP